MPTVCLCTEADVSHIAGKLSRRAFRKCIIRVVDVGKFGRRSGKAGFLTSSVCVNYDGASHFHSFPVPVTHQSFDWATRLPTPREKQSLPAGSSMLGHGEFGGPLASLCLPSEVNLAPTLDFRKWRTHAPSVLHSLRRDSVVVKLASTRSSVRRTAHADHAHKIVAQTAQVETCACVS